MKIVKYVKKCVLNTPLFTALCEDLGTKHKTLLFHTEMRWLSKGNMLTKLFEQRDETTTDVRYKVVVETTSFCMFIINSATSFHHIGRERDENDM